MQLSRVVRPCIAAAFLATQIAILAASPALAQEKPAKPPLSEALRSALAKEPPAAVQKRFMDAFEAGHLDYAFDPQALNALAVEYMQKGDAERAGAVMGIVAASANLVMRDMLPPETAAAMAAAEESERRDRAEREAERAAAPSGKALARERAHSTLGPPRDDLERFHGVYAVPDKANWQLFLVRNCDGHLVMGPMWADVAPWVLRSLGDGVFEYPGDSFIASFRVEIEVDGSGKAIGLRQGLKDVATPNSRTGDLPAGWDPQCGKAPGA